VVEAAKYLSLQPKSIFFIGDADAVCNHQSSTSMVGMLGLDTLEAMSPQRWFENPCGPLSYASQEGEPGANKGLKKKKRREQMSKHRSPSSKGRNASFPRPPPMTTVTTHNVVGEI
jgi:hypothetical protein